MFLLSDHRGSSEAAADGARRYAAYLAERRAAFPPSAYALATAAWYADPRDPRCPHDAWLEAATLAERGAGLRQEVRSAELRVRLLGAYHDGHIELAYSGLARYECAAGGLTAGHGDWLWDEFRLAKGGGVVHEVEWAGGGRWLIEAADVEYRWVPLAGAGAAAGPGATPGAAQRVVAVDAVREDRSALPSPLSPPSQFARSRRRN